MIAKEKAIEIYTDYVKKLSKSTGNGFIIKKYSKICALKHIELLIISADTNIIQYLYDVKKEIELL